jgi:hypothetical protein
MGCETVIVVVADPDPHHRENWTERREMGVDETSIFRPLEWNCFDVGQVPSAGRAFGRIPVPLNEGTHTNIGLWDRAGQKKFRAIVLIRSLSAIRTTFLNHRAIHKTEMTAKGKVSTEPSLAMSEDSLGQVGETVGALFRSCN